MRQRRALSQDDLAAASGVPKVTISRIENDRYGPPRPSTLRKLAGALEVDPGWLLFGNGENQPHQAEGKAAAAA
jgi:transcriptional regulator with XRE-family HTH domain